MSEIERIQTSVYNIMTWLISKFRKHNNWNYTILIYLAY